MLGETKDIKTRLITLTIKVEDLLTKRIEMLNPLEEVPEVCNICELQGHIIRNCPTLPAFNEILNEKTNIFNAIH